MGLALGFLEVELWVRDLSFEPTVLLLYEKEGKKKIVAWSKPLIQCLCSHGTTQFFQQPSTLYDR